MRINIIKNAKRNILFGFVNRVVAVLCPFITRTTIQYILGSEYLGLSSLFQSILSVLNLTELGFSSAIIYSMYKPIAEENTILVNALLNFYRSVYRIIGAVIFLLGSFLIPFLPYFINGTYPDDINLKALYLLYLFNASISYFMFAYMSSLLVVYQRDDINSSTNLIITILLTLSQIFSLIFFHNYFLFSLMMPVFTILNNLRIAFIVKKMFPQYHCEGKIPDNLFADMKKQVVGAFISKVCMVSRNSFDSICASAFLGLTITAMYNNYYYILLAVTSFTLIFSTSITGGVGNHSITKSKEENFQELKEIDFLYMWISGWCTICIMCLSQIFMRIWMGDKMLFPFQIVVLLSLYFYFLKIGDMRSIYSTVNGLWWQQKWRSIVEASANLILNVILAKCFGIFGIILATILTIFFIHTIWGGYIVFKYYFGIEHLIEYFQYHIQYAFITFCICAITWVICESIIFDNSIFSLFYKVCICLFIPNIFYIIIYNRSPYFKRFSDIIKR